MPEERPVDFERVRSLARLARQLGLAELTTDCNHCRVTITCAPPVATAAAPGPAPVPAAPVQASGGTEAVSAAREGSRPVAAPMAGVFYRSPSPDAPPYVEAGTRVEEGDIIGLIEAMKVFNEIAADVAGEVVEVSAQSEQLVKLGQPLVWIRP